MTDQKQRVDEQRAFGDGVQAGMENNADQCAKLRDALKIIYQKAEEKLRKTRRRFYSSEHFCDYRDALHAVKDIAKKALTKP